MSTFQKMDSAAASDDVPTVNSQLLSPVFNDQDMEGTFSTKEEAKLIAKEEAVSKKEVFPSSSERNVEKPHVCAICSKSFSRKNVLIKHMKFCSGEKRFFCNLCNKPFVQESDLRRHIIVHSKTPIQHSCQQCSEVFSKKIELLKHRKIHSKPPIKHNCEQCSEVFPKKLDLLKHRKIHSKPKHICDECSKAFSLKSELLKHRKKHHYPEPHKCSNCSFAFKTKSFLLSHMRTFHPRKPKERNSSLKKELYDKVKHFQRENALNVFTNTTINSNEDNDKDFQVFFNSIRSDVLNELYYQMEEKRKLKWRANVKAILSRVTQDGETETAMPFFHSNTVTEYINDSIPTHVEEAFAKIINSYESFTQRGSGWTLERIVYLEVSTSKF